MSGKVDLIKREGSDVLRRDKEKDIARSIIIRVRGNEDVGRG